MNNQKNPIELEADILRQEHRLYCLIVNWLNRNAFETDDPRFKAIIHCVSWRIFMSLSPAIALGAGGTIGLILAWNANGLLSKQNMLLKTQNEQIVLQNLIAKNQLAIESDVAMRGRKPDWIEIDDIMVEFETDSETATIQVLLRNNSGKICNVKQLQVVTEFKGHVVIQTKTTTNANGDPINPAEDPKNHQVVQLDEILLNLDNRKAKLQYLSCLRKIPDGDTEILKFRAKLPLLPPKVRILEGEWNLKVKVMGHDSFAGFKKPLEIQYEELVKKKEVGFQTNPDLGPDTDFQTPQQK